jgi:hypothetical protein
MNDGYCIAPPGMGYLRTIYSGYEDFELDLSALDLALKMSADPLAHYPLPE